MFLVRTMYIIIYYAIITPHIKHNNIEIKLTIFRKKDTNPAI